MPSPGRCHHPLSLDEASLLTGLPASTASTHNSQEGFFKNANLIMPFPSLNLCVPMAPGLRPSPFS